MKKYGKVLVVLLLLALFLEFGVCNFPFYINNNNAEYVVPFSSMSYSPSAVVTEYGLYFPGSEENVVEIENNRERIKTLALQLSCINGEESWSSSYQNKVYATLQSTMAFVTIVGIKTDGTQTILEQQRMVGSNPNKEDVIQLNAGAEYSKISIVMSGVKGTELVLSSLKINSKVPFRVHPLRILGFFLILSGVYAFRRKSILWTNPVLNEQGKITAGFMKLCMIMGGLLAAWILLLILQNPVYVRGNGGFEPYIELAHAFANHQTYVTAEASEELMNLSNPYDVYERAANGVPYLLDYAYYNGHYYVYFGIVPCLVFYLPCYLILGVDPSNCIVIWLLIVLMIIGIMVLLRAIARRYYPKMSQAMMLLGFIMLLFLGAPPTILSDACAYYIPMLLGIDLIFLGLALWIDAVSEGQKTISLKKVAFGSFLIALVAGCRPQLVFTAILVIPFLGLHIMRERKDIRKLLQSLAAIFIPFVIVAIPLMYYNAIRFGSPFDFGAEYNLTSVNVYETTFSREELKYGLWYYLISLPRLSTEFPFLMQSYPEHILLEGFKVEATSGGVFAGNLILVSALLILPFRSVKKSQRMELRLTQGLLLLLSLAFTMIATAMGGLIERYQIDFAFLLGLAAFLVCMEIVQKSVRSVMTGLMILMFCYQIPRYLMNGVWGLYDANPELYATINNAIAFWK